MFNIDLSGAFDPVMILIYETALFALAVVKV